MSEEQYQELKQWLERQKDYWKNIRPQRSECYQETLTQLAAIRHNWPRNK